MLAILLVEIEWLKENRTPAGAIQRQKYFAPVKIEDEVNLTGDGIFVKKCKFYQRGDSVSSSVESAARLDKILYEDGRGKAFTGSDEYEQKMAGRRSKAIEKDKGSFYSLDKLDIPCITVVEEPNNRYCIKWFDNGTGMPRRRGGNEDFCKKGAKLAGQPNVLNETAFVLEEGQAGLLKFNYRKAYYSGQWYECYYVYVVNAKELSRDVFMREYDFEYDQLADLF